MSFATLKKQSNSVFEKLTKEVEKISNPESGSSGDGLPVCSRKK